MTAATRRFEGALQGRLSSTPPRRRQQFGVLRRLLGELSHRGAFFPFGVGATRHRRDRVHRSVFRSPLRLVAPVVFFVLVPSINEGLRPAVWGSSRRPCQHPSVCGGRAGLRVKISITAMALAPSWPSPLRRCSAAAGALAITTPGKLKRNQKFCHKLLFRWCAAGGIC